MVYFLSEVEQKYLVMNLRPKIRLNPVPEELRGWNWHSPPLKPYYDVKLPMYLICSKYCDTARDVFLAMVEKRRGKENFQIMLGKAVHDAIAKAVREAKNLNFDAEIKHEDDKIKDAIELVWDYTITACKSSFLKARAEQPYASIEDVLLTSMPFLVEHRMNGELLGCSGLISVDCYDYLRNIVYDVKVAKERDEFAKLYTTGYALVIESLYEIPVDVGCTIFLNFKDKLNVKKDLHFIDANLRSWWIEERDRKAEIVYNQTDPGKAEECFKNCLFRGICE
ncbi:MAG TPA: type I-A CRISPR-associated protein Cas4/Csa1 [Archaeoglobaceae archaeon]|nr:type I-A CRISPR-associated protein Cas4/Csa1 [Archaeoglobaceae archaeon]